MIRICQLRDGNMLCYDNEDEAFRVVEVGYPYPELPKSNIEMLRILYSILGIELSELDAINTYIALIDRIENRTKKYTAYDLIMCLSYSRDTKNHCKDRIELNKRNMKTRIEKIPENAFLGKSKVVENIMTSMGLDLKNCKAKVYTIFDSGKLNVLLFSQCDFPIIAKYINISDACYNNETGILIINSEDMEQLQSTKKFCSSTVKANTVKAFFKEKLGFPFTDFVTLLSIADNEESRYLLRRLISSDDLEDIDLKKVMTGVIHNCGVNVFDWFGQYLETCYVGDSIRDILCNDILCNDSSILLDDLDVINIFMSYRNGVEPVFEDRSATIEKFVLYSKVIDERD